MAVRLNDDPVLMRFRAALAELYGDRLERAVLFGSHACGDARPDSDYDVAVFLHDMQERWAEVKRLADLSLGLLDDTGELIHAMPFPAGSHRERTPLMHEVRKDGLDPRTASIYDARDRPLSRRRAINCGRLRL